MADARTLGLGPYLVFPGVGQAFLIRRTRCQVRKGRVVDTTVDTCWGVTSHTPHTADAKRLLRINRGHWTIEGPCIASSMTATAGTRTRAASAPAMGPRT